MAPLGQVYLRLQLASISVNVYTATESKSEITFNQIHKPSGKRVRYQKIVPGIGEITHGREHLVAIAPLNGGLVMDIIRYTDELRPAAPYFQGLDKITHE